MVFFVLYPYRCLLVWCVSLTFRLLFASYLLLAKGTGYVRFKVWVFRLLFRAFVFRLNPIVKALNVLRLVLHGCILLFRFLRFFNYDDVLRRRRVRVRFLGDLSFKGVGSYYL